MATRDTDMISEKQRLIKKRKMDDIVCALETADRRELLENVIKDVGSGHHQQWNAIVTKSKDCLLELVLALHQLYIEKLQLCRKGKDKYTRLQLAWMEAMRDVIHDQSDEDEDEEKIGKSKLPSPVSNSEIQQRWNLVVGPSGQSVDSNALFHCICKAVFSYCQRKIVSIKEGSETEEDESQEDVAQAAALAADEVALFRLGGFPLYAAMKNCPETKLSILQILQMPASEKADLPSNLQHLDKGGLTFPKRELLGYFSDVRMVIDHGI